MLSLLSIELLYLVFGPRLGAALGRTGAQGLDGLLWLTDLVDALLKVIEYALILHELDLEVMIGLVMVGDQVVDSLDEGAEGLAIVFLFEEELLLGEDVEQIHQALAALLA